MAMTVYKDGKRVEEYSTTPGSLVFNEKAEQQKEPSLYNVERKTRGLSDE